MPNRRREALPAGWAGWPRGGESVKLPAMTCFRCGHENPPGSRYCNACGTRLDAAPGAAALRAYTPQHLAEKILTTRAALEGERKQVTVLFANLKGSMELPADRDTLVVFYCGGPN
ncbi:MAG: zinc ribbon domain-containing protein [Candidatus Rokubacteria bacterium]|nr:zinc ribbon domain-containing protein [Candidatus Rokubacteria bacterium]